MICLLKIVHRFYINCFLMYHILINTIYRILNLSSTYSFYTFQPPYQLGRHAHTPSVTATITAQDPWPTKADPEAAVPVSNGPQIATILFAFNAKWPRLI